MAGSTAGAGKVENEPGIFCYARKQGITQRIMGACQLKGAPIGRIWDKVNVKINEDSDRLQPIE